MSGRGRAKDLDSDCDQFNDVWCTSTEKERNSLPTLQALTHDHRHSSRVYAFDCGINKWCNCTFNETSTGTCDSTHDW